MMQRRQVGRGHSAAVGMASAAERARVGRHSSTSASRRSAISRPWVVLVIVAVLVAVSTNIFPEVQQAEHDAIQGAQKLEQGVMDWWSSTGQQQKPPLPGGTGNDSRNAAELRKAATERMLKQESTWVDGEKKLKAKLKLLVSRQQEGKDLGVPVATRWVGDDIPAWAGEGVDVDEWNAKIKVRYDEMRTEEDRWREMVTATMKSDHRG